MTKQQVDEALAANHEKLVALRQLGQNIPASPSWIDALAERRRLRVMAISGASS